MEIPPEDDNVRVSPALSATILSCPLTDIVLNVSLDISSNLVLSLELIKPSVVTVALFTLSLPTLK